MPDPVPDKMVITLEWMKDAGFKMKSKKNEEPLITVVQIAENSHLTALWASVATACQDYFEETLKDITTVMLEP